MHIVKKILRILAIIIAVLLGVLGLAIGVVLIGINVGAGQRYIEEKIDPWTGGMVQISGLSGTLPQNLGLDTLKIKDAKGVWLEIDHLHLKWSPLALIGMDAKIHTLSADRLVFSRLPFSSPEPQAPTSSAPSGPTKLKIKVDLTHLHIGRLEIGDALIGQSAAFTADGNANISSIAPFIDGVTLKNLPKMKIDLHIKRLDADGDLNLSAATPSQQVHLALDYHEGINGFVSSLGKLPQLDPIDLHLAMQGPWTGAVTEFGLHSGAIQSHLNGTINLVSNKADLHVTAHAPTMTLQPGIGWNDISLETDLHGPFIAPVGTGSLNIDSLAINDILVGHLHTSFQGSAGKKAEDTVASLQTVIDGLRIPGSAPTLLAAAPIKVNVISYPLRDTQPVEAVLDHPLVHLGAQVNVKPAAHGHVTLELPNVKPLAALGKTDLQGKVALKADFALPAKAQDDLTLTTTGKIAITGGQEQAVHLIGKEGTLSLDLKKSANNIITVKRLALDGKALHVLMSTIVDLAHQNRMQTIASVALPDLSQVAPMLCGNINLDAQANGPTDDLAVKTDIKGEFGTKDVPKGPLALNADFQHLPSAPQGTLKVQGVLDRRPLILATRVEKDLKGVMHVQLDQLSWNSLLGKGALRLPVGAKVPLGDLDLKISNLADFQKFVGQPVKGRLALAIHTTEVPSAPPVVALGLDGSLGTQQVTISSLNLKGKVTNPLDNPTPDLSVAVAGIRTQDISGQAKATVKGPQSAMAITLQGAFQNVMGSPANIDTALLLDLLKKTVRIDRLAALAKEESIRLGAPAKVSFGDIMGVDRLRLTVAPRGVAPATFDIGGTLKPRLALNATIDHVTPAIAKPFSPELDALGVISAQANLTGTLNNPSGKVSLVGRGLRMRRGVAASLPAAEILANVGLAGQTARVDTTLKAGSKIALAVRGVAPLSKDGNIALDTTGHVDLSVANSVLGANGMETRGHIALNMHVGGSAAQPRATGQIGLHNVAFSQYAQGVYLTSINGNISAHGDSITLDHILAHAGSGDIALDGYVGVFRPGLPMDIKVISKQARVLSSDLITALIDTDLHIHGQATTRLDVDGKVVLPRVMINIPNSMPASVPQLDVVRPGQSAPVSNGTNLVIGLGLDVISPGQFFVQGHGLDVIMGGTLHVKGTSQAPIMTGGFEMRRGNFNLAGINLNFTHGIVSFNGAGVNHRLDPTLDFRADRNGKGGLASLLVHGYASAPKIDFTSVPSLPRDEILSLLLFGTDSHSLSTTQLAELGVAVAQLAGGSTFDPLGKVRNVLGLDRLAVGGGSGVNKGGSSIEAGKYVMKGVYVGAKQAMSGTGTQAQVQIDLTQRLKLKTTVGTGGQVNGFTTPENDPGSSVGLSYGFDY
ncbi:translocation/assembly module TamB domain-containing protein [Swingsia samuiensis]|uniref:Translocation and assembly module TamB C-terminal domain-containing protein n=1 Tax=Swingsia samuiensis TaxID=1293412 RepID=A0A4Y6ULN2_9PROT|nr:translocation/assembly module TamB domain-containing protein [Swingsia samuiensis]QDH17680.1 hypothetical protein E3D00_08970 [Swingsia samuiensis]